jgi:hypothetical protein
MIQNMNKDLPTHESKTTEKWEETPNLGIKRKSGDDLSESSEVPISSARTGKKVNSFNQIISYVGYQSVPLCTLQFPNDF